MFDGPILLEALEPSDVDWFLSASSVKALDRDATLITAGERVDTLYLVQQGVLCVDASAKRHRLAVLGPGDIAGEMSLLEDRLPTETVTALEETKVLALPHAAIEERCRSSADFGARFYRALARLMSQRLQRSNRRLVVAPGDKAATSDSGWSQLVDSLQGFKALLHEADQAARRNEDVVPEGLAGKAVGAFRELLPKMNEVADAAGDERLCAELGLRAQAELLPYLLLAESAERFYSKPRGYAGDFWSIELMYRNVPNGTSRLGPLIDRCFLEAPPCAAVRNRRGLLAEEIGATIAESDGMPAAVTSLACGPAAEAFDVIGSLDDPERVKFTLLDIDLQALAFVADRRDRLKLRKSIELVAENLIHLALGRSQTRIEGQDLVYSIGLIDYFDDALVVKLMNLVHGMLRPGGRIILGNFHPRNPARAFSNLVIEWGLIHRTEEDMNRLYAASHFARPCTAVRFEEQEINLFAECVKT